MKRNYAHKFVITLAVLALIVISGCTVVVPDTMTVAEPTSTEAGKCTLHTLNGTYVFEGGGVIIDGEGAVPYAEAGWQTFDGEGNSVGMFSFSLDGEAVGRQELFESTYELNPEQECVFTVFAPVGDEVVTFDLYGTPAGTNFSYFGPGFSGRLMRPSTLARQGTSALAAQEAQMRAASAAWDEAFNAGDLERLTALYAEDAVDMPPGFPALEGIEAISGDLQYIFETFEARHQTSIVDLKIDGDLALERANYSMTMIPKAGGETVTEVGKHIVVRQKIGNEWKVLWEIWNTDGEG